MQKEELYVFDNDHREVVTIDKKRSWIVAIRQQMTHIPCTQVYSVLSLKFSCGFSWEIRTRNGRNAISSNATGKQQ